MGCYTGMLVGRVGGSREGRNTVLEKNKKIKFVFNLFSIVNYPHRVVNVVYDVQILKL